MAKKRAAGKRDLVKSRAGKFYAKRTAKGRFKEMDRWAGRWPLIAGRKPSGKRSQATATLVIGNLR